MFINNPEPQGKSPERENIEVLINLHSRNSTIILIHLKDWKA